MSFEIIREFIRRDIRAIRKNLLFAIVFALLYGLEAYFVQMELLAGHGDLRPLIFLPSLAGIAFGPMFGGVVGGFGNLISDIITKLYVEKKALHMGHFVGFLANFIGAYVVGLLSVDIDVRKYGLFSKKSIKDYIWNTIAGCIGMGGVTGFIVGIGLWMIGKVNLEIGIAIAGSIMLWNSLFNLLLLIILPIYGYAEMWYLIKSEKEREYLTKFEIVKKTPNNIVDLEKGEIVEGKPIEREWINTLIRIKNISDTSLRYKIEMIGPDIIQPSVKFSKKLPPGEYDDITFSMYPLDSGERHFRVRILPWTESAEETMHRIKDLPDIIYELKYKAIPETSEKLSALTSFIGVMALLALLFKGIYDLIRTKEVSGLTVAIAFFIAEIILIILWYIWKKYSLAKTV